MMKVLKKKRKGGFTLIELIVVIAILGILAAIAVPRFAGFTEQARKAADEQSAATIAKAMELYYTSNNNATATPAQLVTANLVDVKTLIPGYLPATNLGFSVTMANGKATVFYSAAVSTAGTPPNAGAAAWPAAGATQVYPRP